jgi:phosphoglycerate dehydrogenase-like enzyme
MLPKVLVDKGGIDAAEGDWQRLLQHIEAELVERENPYSEDELIAALQGCSGLIRLGSHMPDLTRRVFAEVPELKIAGVRGDRFGTGVDMDAASEFDVKIIDTDNISSSQPVAEWDLAMMLICLRNAGAVYRQMMQGTETWAVAGNADFVSGELTERKVGLIGCGHVGQRLIELLRPFRVDLLVYDPYISDDLAYELEIVCGEMDDVLGHADILVVQVPHTPNTEKMIGARELDLLGTGKILVNCSRGKVIDQQALIEKLEAGELIAGLDVFDPEPMEKDNPLRHMPNAFITPHIAWYAPHALSRCFGLMAEEFEHFFTGEPLQYELTRRMVDIRSGQL